MINDKQNNVSYLQINSFQNYIKNFSNIFNEEYSLFSNLKLNIDNLFSSVDDDGCRLILREINNLSEFFEYIKNSFISKLKDLNDLNFTILEKSTKRKNKINNLKEELRLTKEKINNLEINLNKSENNYDLLKNDYMKVLNNLNEKNNEFEKEKNKFIEEHVQKYKLENNELRKANEELTNKNKKISLKFLELKSEKDRLAFKYNILKKEYDYKKEQISNREIKNLKVIKENENLNKMIKTLKTENEELNRRNSTLEIKIQNTTTEMRRQSMFNINVLEREKSLADFLNNSFNCNNNMNQNDDDKKSLQTFVISNKTSSSFDESKSKDENEENSEISEDENYNLKSLDKFGLQLETEENSRNNDSISKIEITTPFQIKNMYEKFNQISQSNFKSNHKSNFNKSFSDNINYNYFSSIRSKRKKILLKRKNFSVNFDAMSSIKEENEENEKENSYYLYDMY
jgi:hypothetical protein